MYSPNLLLVLLNSSIYCCLLRLSYDDVINHHPPPPSRNFRPFRMQIQTTYLNFGPEHNMSTQRSYTKYIVSAALWDTPVVSLNQKIDLTRKSIQSQRRSIWRTLAGRKKSDERYNIWVGMIEKISSEMWYFMLIYVNWFDKLYLLIIAILNCTVPLKVCSYMPLAHIRRERIP